MRYFLGLFFNNKFLPRPILAQSRRGMRRDNRENFVEYMPAPPTFPVCANRTLKLCFRAFSAITTKPISGFYCARPSGLGVRFLNSPCSLRTSYPSSPVASNIAPLFKSAHKQSSLLVSATIKPLSGF